MRRFAMLLLVLGSLVSVSPARAQMPVAKVSKAPVPKQVAAPIKKMLAADSFSATRGGKEIARFWIRSNIPTTATKAPATYDRVAEGTLVGVVEIAGNGLTDFRDQELKPGVYTLRIGLHPEDGNHMGIAVAPEFLCLCPATSDKSADVLGHDDLMDLSKESQDTGHPVVLFMHTYFSMPDFKFPSVTTNESDHVVFNILAKSTLKDKSSADMPIGIIIVGTTDAE